MSQILPQSLPDTQTPASQLKFEDVKEVWGKLIPRRLFLNILDLSEDVYTLGRKENCDVCLSAKNMPHNLLGIISKQHFLISRDSSLVPYIQDTSRNGTFLNGGLIGKGNTSTLCSGDIIAIGNARLEVYAFKDESYSTTEYGAKYKETRFLGRGAFGEVYLAFSKTTCRRYAVKKIQKLRLTYGQVKSNDEKIQNEIKILQTLKHPCIIHLEEIINSNDIVYIILEYMEGGELRNRIVKNIRLSEDVTKLYFYQMTLALQYLHKKGITHRDLKPENILLATNDDMTLIKVSDFGLSKIIDNDTVLKSLCGTPMFVAPEVVRNNGKGTYTQQIDIWSLGVILFCCLCGEPPFYYDVDDSHALFIQILNGSYTVPENIKERLTEDALDMLAKTLVVDPSKRITVDEIFKHKWMKDTDLQIAVKQLLIDSEQ